jgi:cytochrome oxidase Cu insertion factor (SCO1/SenC/PrrC family)
VSPELTHSNSLALVDHRGRIRGYYATNPEELAALERDLRTLASDLPKGSCEPD